MCPNGPVTQPHPGPLSHPPRLSSHRGCPSSHGCPAPSPSWPQPWSSAHPLWAGAVGGTRGARTQTNGAEPSAPTIAARRNLLSSFPDSFESSYKTYTLGELIYPAVGDIALNRQGRTDPCLTPARLQADSVSVDLRLWSLVKAPDAWAAPPTDPSRDIQTPRHWAMAVGELARGYPSAGPPYLTSQGVEVRRAGCDRAVGTRRVYQ